MHRNWLATFAQKELLIGRPIRWTGGISDSQGTLRRIDMAGESLVFIRFAAEKHDGTVEIVRFLASTSHLVEFPGDRLEIRGRGGSFSATIILPPLFRPEFERITGGEGFY